jgi:hypothetical protein
MPLRMEPQDELINSPHLPKAHIMNSALHQFLSQYLYVVIATLVPVVLVAFLTIPLSLGGHPGEARVHLDQTVQHWT